jgi:serine/threonine protein kinase
MPPEYVVHGHYSTKSDVYSFGILVLEIITGRRNCASYNSTQTIDLLIDLVSAKPYQNTNSNPLQQQSNNVTHPVQVWEHWTKGTILAIADPLLTSSSAEDKIRTCVHIGLLCVQESPADRPTMSAVNAILNSDGAALQAPSRPAFCPRRASSADPEPRQRASQSHGGGNSAAVSLNGVSITELVPR